MATANVSQSGDIVLSLCAAIQEAKAYLSEVDGAIGDGDHGINMAKGFTLAEDAIKAKPGSLPENFATLSKILMTKIGGSMGPLYGMFFRALGKACEGKEEIDAAVFAEMVNAARQSIGNVSPAKPGDKTLMDTLVPAVEAYNAALEAGKPFPEALADLKAAAEAGRDSTKDMVAKLGRASRLGERSRGVLDAGATSCCLILVTLADGILAKL